MANDIGHGSLSASILFEEIKSRLSGKIEHTPDSNEKCVYKKHIVPSSPSNIFTINDEYLGNLGASDGIANGDEIVWLAIKHSGFSTLSKIATTEGVMINFSGASKPPLFNGSSANNQNNIFISPGELLIIKVNGVNIEDLIAGTCKLSGSKPSAAGSSGALIYAAAIIADKA